MRFGKKTTIAETKKTRSCVVRLEKVSQPSPSPPATVSTRRTPPAAGAHKVQQKGGFVGAPAFARNRKNSVGSGGSGMGASSKQPTTAPHSRDEKLGKGPIKRLSVGSTGSKMQTSQQRQTVANVNKAQTSQQRQTVPSVSKPQTPQQRPTVTTVSKPLTPHQRQATFTGGKQQSSQQRPIAANTSSKLQTPQQKQTVSTTSNMSVVRSNQKIKVIPRSNKAATTNSSPQVSVTQVRDDTPTPTIAAGRSRRAIKPNPKYASEDMVTPKMVRNVGMSKTAAASEAKQRKISSSSDDFYNNNSDDDYEDPSKKSSSNFDDIEQDEAYKVDEKEAAALDSDISEIEEELTKRTARLRGKSRRIEVAPNQNVTKATNQTSNTNLKLGSNPSVLPIRTAPTQLQQLRRSLASANAQRNQSLLAGSNSLAQKRKLDESMDSDDSDISYPVARKQMLFSNSSGVKVRVPVKQSSAISNTTPLNRNRVLGVQKIGSSTTSTHAVNGKQLSAQIMERKKLIESSKKSVDLPPKTGMRSTLLANKLHLLTSGRTIKNQIPSTKPATVVQTSNASNKTVIGKTDVVRNRMRSSSPRPSLNRESLNNSGKTATPSATSFSQQQQKKLPTLASKPLEKNKAPSTPNLSNASATPLTLSKSVNSRPKPLAIQQNPSKSSQLQQNTTKTLSLPAINVSQTVVINDESPNSTMDDFETMPTFTIVNVNDIINKKGDVLITKSKSPPTNDPKTTVIEFSESISLDEDEDDDDGLGENIEMDKSNKHSVAPTALAKSSPLTKSSPSNSMEIKKNKILGTRISNETTKKPTPTASYSKAAPIAKPQILNHQLGLRNNQTVTPKITASAQPTAPVKPAPRILNSVVAKRTEPVKPMIANLDDSAEESFPLSLDEEETEDEAESKSFGTNEKKSQSYLMDLDTDDTESQDTEPDEPAAPVKALAPKNTSTVTTTPTSPQSAQRKRRPPNSVPTPIVVSNKKRVLTPPAAAKENSLAATNQQVNDAKSSSPMSQTRKPPAEKVVISKQGDKIIKKITCFETWYVINMPLEPKRQPLIRNQLDIPLIKLANNAKTINLPSDLWSCKVTLYELSAMTLAKSTFAKYTGDLTEYNINEEDRAKYQPSCVMFRRSIENRQQSRMPYDRAVIFKNKTFSTNIEGKNIRLVGAPSVVNSEREIEILLEVVDALTLQSDFVENTAALQ